MLFTGKVLVLSRLSLKVITVIHRATRGGTNTSWDSEGKEISIILAAASESMLILLLASQSIFKTKPALQFCV